MRNRTPKRNKIGKLQRAYNNKVKLYVPKEVWIKKLQDYKALQIKSRIGQEQWKPVHRRQLQNKTDMEILKQFNHEVRGYYNYYKIVNNVAVLHKYNYFMFYSMLKTLARKYKSSVKKIRKKYDINGEFGIAYNSKDTDRAIVYYNGGFRRQKLVQIESNLDIRIEYKYPFGRYSPGYNIKNRYCQLCNAHNVDVWIHHVRKLSRIEPDSPWNSWMLQHKRKTISVCKHCYQIIRAART
jgi:Type II intron maturase.